MRIAIIGRSQWLFDAAVELRERGHRISLVITAREAPEYTRTVEDFRRLAAECGAAFLQTPTLEAAEVADVLDGGEPFDIGVSVNYPGIISAATISRFRLGILNAHAGDLPRYRGNACQAWAILNGEARIGLCVHRMVGGELDAGDIITRAYRPLSIDDRIGEVFDWIGREAPRLFLDAVTLLQEAPSYCLERQSISPADALRCYPRTPQDGRIAWSQSNEQVLRLVNASSEPFAGAFCLFETERLTIWRARLHHDEERYLAVPGQVAAVDAADGSVIVICGRGKLRIQEVQAAGERFAPTAIIRSTRMRLT